MKQTIADIKSAKFYGVLPKEFLYLGDKQYLSFYYLYDDSKSKIIDIKGLQVVSAITTLVYKNRPFTKEGAPYAIGGLQAPFDTQQTFFYLFLKYYCEKDEQASKDLLDFFVKAKAEDIKGVADKMSYTTFNNSFEIVTRDNFCSALDRYLFCPPQTTTSVLTVVDVLDGYYRRKKGKSIFYNCIEKVVTGMTMPQGGLIPEKGGSFEYFYVGEKSKLSDDKELQVAKDMIRNKFSASDVYTKTGWLFSNRDAKWRKFVDDKESSVVEIPKNTVFIKSGSKFAGQENNVFRLMGGVKNVGLDYEAIADLFYKGWDVVLGDVLQHPTIYKHYPALYNTPVFFGNNSKKKADRESCTSCGGQGCDNCQSYWFFYSPAGYLVIMGNEEDGWDLRTVMLHEMQHNIQGVENFSQGGSPELASQIMAIGGENVKKYIFLKQKIGDLFVAGATVSGVYSYQKFVKFQKDSVSLGLEIKEIDYYKRPGDIAESLVGLYLRLNPTIEKQLSIRNKIINFLSADTKYAQFKPILDEIDGILNKAENKRKSLRTGLYSDQEIESIFFSMYESLQGEIEARDVQHTSMVEAELKGYLLPSTSEYIEEDKITSIFKGMIAEGLPTDIQGGVENIGDGKYIIHLFDMDTPEPILHELGHILYDLLRDQHDLTMIDARFPADLGMSRPEVFCELFLCYLAKQNLSPRFTNSIIQSRSLMEQTFMDEIFDSIFKHKEDFDDADKKLMDMFKYMKNLNDSLDRSQPPLPEPPKEKEETKEFNLYPFFANPERFPDYEGEFLYPPRAESRFRPEGIARLDNDEYLAQPKLNGSATSVTIWEDGFVAKERHNTFFAVPPTFDFQALHRGKGKMCIIGEFMNKSKKDETGKPFKGFCIWDIVAINGKILIGSTIEERVKLLSALYPELSFKSVDGYAYLSFTEVPDIYKVGNFTSMFSDLYDTISKVDMIEGMVLKKKTGKLEMPNRESSNTGWATKVRKPTRNYEH